MRKSSTKVWIVFSSPDCANAGAVSASTIANMVGAELAPPSANQPRPLRSVWVCILCSRFLNLFRDLARERLRRDDAREGTKAENPASERAIEADVQRHQHGAARPVVQLLRLVPLARRHVLGDRRLELDLDALRRSGVDAQRVRERLVRQFFDRDEPLLQ